MGESAWEGYEVGFSRHATSIPIMLESWMPDLLPSNRPIVHMLGRLLPLDADRVHRNIEALGLLATKIDALTR